MVKIVIIIAIAMLVLTGCAEELRTLDGANKGCAMHEGVAYFHQFSRVICNDGLEIL